jgi:hypothetical protein
MSWRYLYRHIGKTVSRNADYVRKVENIRIPKKVYEYQKQREAQKVHRCEEENRFNGCVVHFYKFQNEAKFSIFNKFDSF